MASIRKQKYNFRAREHPQGRDLIAVKSCLRQRQALSMRQYVHEVIDQREEDEFRLTRDQVGVVVLMWDEDLIRRAIQSPTFGCDGTFSVVAKNSDDLDFELVSIICQEPRTKRVFSPMRMLASRKTTACRCLLFERFFNELKKSGLPDPLNAASHQRLTVSTDFETTFAISIGRTLAEIYRPDSNLGETANAYVEKVVFGCGVHAHRIVLEKINKRLNPGIYNWMINSRLCHTEEEVVNSISYMKSINLVTLRFAVWLEQNYVARVLWFWRR